MPDTRDIPAEIEKALNDGDGELLHMVSLLEDAANEIRRLRGEPLKPKRF
jgi:hypothetical protein